MERELEHAEQMVEHHIGGAVFIGVDPVLSMLRGLPRYDGLVKRVGVPLPRTASAPHTTST